MTSNTTTKATSPKTSRKSHLQSQKNSRKHSLKDSVKHSVKKPNRINRQRRLQKQLQALLLERHSRRCIICHHPEREAIEEEFVHWRAPWKLSQDYKLADYRTVYRHARAAGLLLQRRERLHSALDAFVESVDDATFTGDTILRAMRAYSCIDNHGRWTEIPTQVQSSTSNDAHPPQPSPRTSNVGSDVIDIDPDAEPEDGTEENAENPPEERVTALDVLNVIRKYSNQAPRSGATTCAKSPAQASSVTEDEYDELEDDDSDADEESEEDAENDAENQLEEFVASLSTSSKSSSRSDNTACSTSSKSMSHSDTACSTSSKSTSRSDTTACAASPAQAVSVSDFENDPDNEDDPDDDPDDDVPDDVPDDVSDNDPKNKSGADRLEETTACAAPPAQSAVALGSNHRGRTVTATASASSKTRSRSDATACADSPVQALPRDVVRGQNPNDRSLSDRTDCAALPSGGAPAQPAAPPKPKPDADGFIWHPLPGYPDQEISEPDAQGRVAYKIHMTTGAAQLPSA